MLFCRVYEKSKCSPKPRELKIVKVSKLYVDNLYIVNNWTNGVIKENQNEVIKELIPVATALKRI